MKFFLALENHFEPPFLDDTRSKYHWMSEKDIAKGLYFFSLLKMKWVGGDPPPWPTHPNASEEEQDEVSCQRREPGRLEVDKFYFYRPNRVHGVSWATTSIAISCSTYRDAVFEEDIR